MHCNSRKRITLLFFLAGMRIHDLWGLFSLYKMLCPKGKISLVCDILRIHCQGCNEAGNNLTMLQCDLLLLF